jgi:hypothetical protein
MIKKAQMMIYFHVKVVMRTLIFIKDSVYKYVL